MGPGYIGTGSCTHLRFGGLQIIFDLLWYNVLVIILKFSINYKYERQLLWALWYLRT